MVHHCYLRPYYIHARYSIVFLSSFIPIIKLLVHETLALVQVSVIRFSSLNEDQAIEEIVEILF